ncbi:glycosyltransferase [Saccharopolyspora sp. WRP15-2]|uniref:Glycosyltransferase n=1 Tax=Saccharopolyspora oryzae TaxID=2997343 RepID=A0ABT4UUL1_9PSEU|nr:glycosyltransferase [Saccharopolyspora oryzae]MDA3624737.1 glycosyltransferase [Saccharopolyspora oryzae]
MKVLFVAGGSGGVIFAITPLAQTLRNLGHEVFMAAPSNVMSTVAGGGIAPVPVTDKTMLDFMFSDRNGVAVQRPTDVHDRTIFNGRGMGRFAAASFAGLKPFTEHWKPDLVVGGALSFAAPLIAAHLGVPFVNHAIDMGEPRQIDLAATAELAPELESLGLRSMPEPDLFVDICPPSLRRADAPPAQLMRYIPANTQTPVEPWMHTAGERPRVLVTAGSRVTKEFDIDILRGLVDKVGGLDVELLIAVPPSAAEELGTLPDNVRMGWLPLDVVARTCSLLVHHTGGNTMLTGMANGVPQVLIPYLPYVVDYATRLTDYGAATMITPGDDTPENLARACEELLADPTYRTRAASVAAEMRGLPTPFAVAERLEKLVAER